MITHDGTRLQGSLQEHPAVQTVQRAYGIKLGIVAGVFFADNGQNPTSTVVVNVTLLNGGPDIYRVPVMSPKINMVNGEADDPEQGDQVVVGFINDNFYEPIIIGFLPPPGNKVQGNAAETPRFFRTLRGFWEKIKKDGGRETHVKVDEDLTIEGKRTTIIEGNETVTINSGDITITATAGKCTVHIQGKTAWTSDGTIELDGGSGTPKGCVQLDSICPLLKTFHIHGSATVKASK